MSKLKKKCVIFIIISCIVILFSGCGEPKKTTVTEGKEKVSIMLDWYPNAVHSAIYTALEKGYFADEGLDVDIKMPAETNDPLKLVAAGKVDLALSYQPQLIVARAEGIPVVSLAAYVSQPLNYLMVPKSSNIHRPKELEGKNIGYSSIEFEQAVLQTMVKNDGGNPKNVKLTDVGFDLIPAIATNKVDGIIGGYINHERILLDKEGHPVKAFSPTDYGIPNYYELILISSEKGIAKKRKTFERFWNAVSKGQEDVTKNPQKGLDILFKHESQTFPLDHKVEKKSLNILIPLMNGKHHVFGQQDKDDWEKIVDWLYMKKVIKNKIDVEQAFVNLE